MKKSALLLVAVALGSTTASAQLVPSVSSPDPSFAMERSFGLSANTGGRLLKIEDLPEAVQEQLQEGEFANYAIQAISELSIKAHTAYPSVRQYEIKLKEPNAPATAEPRYIVLFDENGLILSHTRLSSSHEEEDHN